MQHLNTITQTKQTAVPALVSGEVITMHGCIFRVRDRKDVFDLDGKYECTSFRTDLLDNEQSQMPKHWEKDWVVQGNWNASVRQVIDPVILAQLGAYSFKD